jgi:hypothetical protein
MFRNSHLWQMALDMTKYADLKIENKEHYNCPTHVLRFALCNYAGKYGFYSYFNEFLNVA